MSNLTVGQLIEKLQKFDPNLPVSMSSDQEGNDFGFLYDVDIYYVDEDGHPLAEEDADETCSQAIVLWP